MQRDGRYCRSYLNATCATRGNEGRSYYRKWIATTIRKFLRIFLNLFFFFFFVELQLGGGGGWRARVEKSVNYRIAGRERMQPAADDESRVIGFQFARGCHAIDSSFGTIAKHRVAVAIKIRAPPLPPPSPPPRLGRRGGRRAPGGG
ncbi:hypothetical protein PUN28_000132 [Cardiocondyla obscurior]|uniref:Uncharacterized protein n=1 Tax=Cardiocondyla obscurior TaxID=286306 RepID=A0AAW2GY75_9HYME